MSYLDPPRIHFAGQFWTNPSTINNATENYNLDEVYNNEPPSDTNPNSVWWNQYGQAFFKVPSAQVTAALSPSGQLLTTAAADPIIGAPIESVITGGPPTPQYGRLVDLDPDQQARSMIVGLALQLTLGDVSLTGVVRPMDMTDVWGKVIGGSGGGIETAGAMFQSVLEDLQWQNIASTNSDILKKLYQASPQMLSIKISVDGYNGDPTSGQFAYGRLIGVIGPYFSGEPVHFLKKRRMFTGGDAVQQFYNQNNPSPMNAAPFQVNGNTLTIDLSNSVPATGVHAGPFMNLGPVQPVIIVPNGQNLTLPPLFTTPQQYTQQYQQTTAIYDVTMDANAAALIQNNPLGIQIAPPSAQPGAVAGLAASRLKEGLTVAQTGEDPGVGPTTPSIALAEFDSGLFADVDLNSLRLQKGAPAWSDAGDSGAEITSTAEVTVYVTKFGNAVKETINFSLAPNFYQFRNDQGQVYQINNTPLSAVTLNGQAVTATGKYPVTTDATTGQAVVTFAAAGLSASQREERRKDIDGQVFLFTYDYTMDGVQPISLLIFEDSPYVANPTWWADIYPIFLQYARLYPAMRDLIDLSDYDSVTNSNFGIPDKIKAVLNLPMAHPGYMPVTRDLSLLRLDMINRWFAGGMPEGTKPVLA